MLNDAEKTIITGSARHPRRAASIRYTAVKRSPRDRRPNSSPYGNATSTVKNRNDGSPPSGTSLHPSNNPAFPFTFILGTNELPASSVEWLNSNFGLPPIHSQITTTIIINYQLFNACIIFSRSPLPDVEQRSNFNPHFSKMPFFMRSRSACFVPFL